MKRPGHADAYAFLRSEAAWAKCVPLRAEGENSKIERDLCELSGIRRDRARDNYCSHRASGASARAHPPLWAQENIEKSSAFSVMNSSSVGTPSRVLAIPRLIAGTISSGSVIRSP